MDRRAPDRQHQLIAASLLIISGLVALDCPPAPGGQWSPSFNLPGTNLIVYALTGYQGDLVAGGMFQMAGLARANNVARWDGEGWHSLGEGVDGTVNVLAEYGNDLIAAGNYEHAGGISANHIARWDGQEWHAMAEGLEGKQTSLVVLDGHLYAGNDQGLHRWDGTQWAHAIAGINGAVWSLAVFQGQLLVGCGAGIQVCDGESYSALPAEYNPTLPMAMVADDSSIFAVHGGDLAHFSIWRNGEWQQHELDWLTTRASLALHQGRIFVGWTWDHWSDSGYSFDLKVWNGSALLDPQPAVGGSEESLLCLLSLNERLYAGGHFADMASTPARNIAEWSDGNWHAVVEDYAASLGLPRSIRATTCLPNGRLIVSDGRRVHEWRYDSWASWTWPYAEYYDGYVLLALGHIAGELVVGGYKCNYMEINEDELWSLLWIPELRSRSSFSGQMIVEIFNHDSHCYVGFKSSLDDVVIREYLQDEWIELDGVPIGLACHEFGSYRGFLVAGGSFHEAGGEPAGNLAIWDGSRWAGFTSGVDGPVYCLLQFGDDLVVAGDFLEAGGQSVGRIASWDGEDWRSLGDGFDDAVHDLVLHEGILVAGGRFHHSGDDSVSSLAFWNGSTWRDLGGGIGGLVNEMTSVPDEGLFIGGNFQTAGNTPSLNIALWEGSIVGTWLAGLTARRDGGAVLIAWELGELEPGAGFHIWREEVRDGAGRIRLTAAPLAAGLAGAWTDPAPPPGAALYRLQLVAPDGGTRWLGSAELPAAPPPALRLDAAPNPFNPRTTIRYRLPVAQQATLAVHDLRGRLVRVLAEGRRTAGEHSATWDGLDRRGAAVAAGVYLLRLQTPDGVRSRKLVLAR